MKDYVRKDEMIGIITHVLFLLLNCGKKTATEWLWKSISAMPTVQLDETLAQNSEPKVEMAVEFYDTEEIHHNCTVHVWSNSKTGAVSIGWEKEGDETDGRF